MSADALRAAADAHVTRVSTLVVGAVGAARQALDLAALDAALAARDRVVAWRLTDAAVAALAAHLGGQVDAKAARRTGRLRGALSDVVTAGGKASTLCVPLTRRARARLAANPARKDWQDRGEANEQLVADMIRGLALDDNEPMDVTASIAGRLHGIEVKTFVDNKASKVTMSTDALRRKRAWRRRHTATIHTVVIDDRDLVRVDLFSGHKVYYRRGVGSFRLDSMTPVEDAAHLRRLLLASR